MTGAGSPQPTAPGSASAMRTRVNSLARRGLSRLVSLKTRCLLVTLGVDCLMAFALAFGELKIATTPFALLGAGIMSVIGIANFWAFDSVRRHGWPARNIYQATPAARETVIAQVATLFMAIYIIVIDAFQAPRINWLVLAVTAAISLLALLWILVLLDRVALRKTRNALIVTSLIPLAGGLQFWLQNYYIPDTSAPQVDISPQLSPQGKTNSTIHLSAKVTVHNRGAARVNVTAALMRITAYGRTTEPQQPHIPCRLQYADQPWCLMVGGLDISGANYDADVRVNPTPAANAQLLYAGLFLNDPDSFLMPGETDTVQREVDVEAGNVNLVRLSVSAVFLTERKVEDIRSCWQTKASAYTDYGHFSEEVRAPFHSSDQGNLPPVDARALQHYLCMDYHFAPRSIIEWLIGNRAVLEVHIVLNDPQDPGNEYPQIESGYFLANRKDQVMGQTSWRKIEEAYPVGVYRDVAAEYAPADQVLGKDNNFICSGPG